MGNFCMTPTYRMRLLESEHAQAPAMGDGLKRIHRLANALCRGVGLDIGCGPVALPGSTGVDIGRAHTGRAEDLSAYPAGSYDYVFSSHCLEHVDDPERAISEMRRVLKPGGVAFFYLPFPGHPGWDPQFPPGRDINHHKWQPEPSSVCRMLLMGGFRVEYAEWEKDHLHSFVVVGVRLP